MIVYLDRTGAYRRPAFIPDTWTVGGKRDIGTLCITGELWATGWPEPSAWRDIGDNFSAALVEPHDPLMSTRTVTTDGRIILADGTTSLSWLVTDSRTRQWLVPVASVSGRTILPLAWGPKGSRIATPLQQMLVDIAKGADTLLDAETPKPDEATLVDWAADVIAAAHYADKSTLLALGLLDDTLIGATLAALCGLRPGDVHHDGA